MTRLLYRAYHAGDRKLQRTADALLQGWDALGTFATHEGVEPPNNEGERSLRTATIGRKTSFGSKSQRGLRLIERGLPAPVPYLRAFEALVRILSKVCQVRRG